MTNKLIYQRDYTELLGVYQLKLPLELGGLIPEDDSVRLLSHELEELDYTKLYLAYSAKGRNPAVDPKTMFKILTYAYSQNIYSSRKIEKACRRDINFMWLLAGQKAPDHTTIARFRTGFLADACEDLFYQFVRKLFERHFVSGETLFIDGTKLEACANKYTFVWKKSVGRWESRMSEQIEAAIQLLNTEYNCCFSWSQDERVAKLQEICSYLNLYCREHQISMVYGRGNRKPVHQKYLEMFEKFLSRQILYDLHHSRFEGRNSYSKTDPDATFMHMKDDHMRNAQLKPGYNVQIGVDSEFIISAGIFQDRNDYGTLIPFLKEQESRSGYRYPSITADAGYEREENYVYLEETGQTPYIKPQLYEKWKKRSFKKDISRRENMRYLEEGDVYVCHNNRLLWPAGMTSRKSVSGYRSRVTIYECEDCNGCKHRENCTKSKKNKKLYVSKVFIEKQKRSYENICTEAGIRYRVNRSIQVEGAFGVLKNDYEFQRFLLRGKTKVKLEILLLCFGYNINKLHTKIQNERLKNYLFEVKSA